MADSTRIKADLIPYGPEYARDVRSWIDSEETCFALFRSREFPPPPRIVETWQRDDVRSYLLVSDKHPVAYGELWLRAMAAEVEIGRLLVDPFRRGQGFGTKMMRLLFERAAERPRVTKVVVNLYSDNEEALGCYLNAGFEVVGATERAPGLRLARVVAKRTDT